MIDPSAALTAWFSSLAQIAHEMRFTMTEDDGSADMLRLERWARELEALVAACPPLLAPPARYPGDLGRDDDRDGASFHHEALASPPQSEGWQPIETAPKDTDVIIFVPPDRVGEAIHSTSYGWLWACDDNVVVARWYPAPTHWMALPSPPSAPTGEAP